MDVSAGEDNLSTTVRLPNASQACEQCRKKKIRCIQDSEAHSCERCQRLRKECVPHIPEKPRKRQRRLTNRLGELERNMGRIANLLESTHDQQRSSQKSSDESNPDERIVQTAPSCDATGHPRGSIISSPTNLLSSRDSGVDMIEQGLLSIKQAETLFTSYQKMAPNFPYVVIHPDTTVTQLRRDSPMLLNAMFLTGAYSDRGLHHLLQEQYLKLLSSKSMIAGEASMDLLQSVLIYLAWMHLHVKPRVKHAFRIASLAVSIILDLGINRPPGKSEQQRMNIYIDTPNTPVPAPTNSDYWPPESRRAVVGCYILSTTYAISGRKTTLMKYSEYLSKCANSLSDEGSVFSDTIIPSHLAHTRYIEQLCEAFGYIDEPHQFQQLNDDQILTYLGIFSLKLDDWKRSIPESLQEAWSFVSYYHITQAYTKEVAVHGITPGVHLSITRTNMLLTCLSSVKEYMDIILTLPLKTMQIWAAPDWAWLNYAVLLAAKITSIQTSTWNIQTTRPILKLDDYLEHLIARVDELHGDRLPGEEPNTWYQYLLTKWIYLNAVYLSSLMAAETNAAGPTPVLNVTQSVPAPNLNISSPSGIQNTPNIHPSPNETGSQFPPRASRSRTRQSGLDVETSGLPDTMIPDDDDSPELTDATQHALDMWLSNTMGSFIPWDLENTFC